MIKQTLIAALTSILFFTSPYALAAQPKVGGLISVESAFNVDQTTQNLENVLKAKGMKVFATVDHSAGAESVDLSLRPTKLVLFGNPKVGTPLMNCQQSVAIDLPQKALIWEDEAGKTWFSYNAPNYLKFRHKVADCDAVIEKITGALANFAKAATTAK